MPAESTPELVLPSGPGPPPSSPATAPASPVRPASRRSAAAFARSARTFVRVMRANPLSFVGFVLVVLVVVTALLVFALPPLTTALFGHPYSIVPHDPNQLNLGPNQVNQPPSVQHPFGTDGVGRDVFSRVLTALPTDLGIGFAVAGSGLLVGLGLGLVAGYWDRPRSVGGALSTTILRVTDIFLAFPTLVLALAITASLGPSLTNAMIAVFVSWWPWYVRLVRGEVLVINQQPYVTA